MPTEQEVIVKIEDGGEYPAMLFGGRTSFTWVSSSLGLDTGCCEHCTTQSIAITIGDFAIQLGQHQAISSQLLLKSIHIQPPPLSVHAH